MPSKTGPQHVKENPRFAGMSIDEILYGEKGVWTTNNLEDHDN